MEVDCSYWCNSNHFQGEENKDETTLSDLEKAKADVPKEVECEVKDLSLPQKEECKEVDDAEEIIPLEKKNFENKNPATGAEASKKNKKKKKKAAPATSEDIGEAHFLSIKLTAPDGDSSKKFSP